MTSSSFEMMTTGYMHAVYIPALDEIHNAASIFSTECFELGETLVVFDLDVLQRYDAIYLGEL